MDKKGISKGTVHPVPADVQEAILSTPAVHTLWEDISPIARNEWICWITSGKKAETRTIRIEKALSKMKGGMRRPCCWEGCTHRTDKKPSPSQEFVLRRKAGK
jgi:hypothetical protein